MPCKYYVYESLDNFVLSVPVVCMCGVLAETKLGT